MPKEKEAEPTREEKLLSIVKELNKEYGEGTIITNGAIPQVERFSSGCLSLDIALGGGWPRGRIIELVGDESCLAGDSWICYQNKTLDGRLQNSKGGTIERLYERFTGNKVIQDRTGLDRLESHSKCVFYVPSIDENNRVITNQVVDVRFTGEQECFLLTAATGESIKATANHLLYIGDSCYRRLDELSVGDTVYIHNNTRFKGRKERGKYKEICVKYHPHWGKKIVEGKYPYHRGRVSEAVIEAQLNNLEYDEYVHILNMAPVDIINNLKFIDYSAMDVHHKDHNSRNDSLDNLVLLSKSEHYRYHALQNDQKLRFIAIPDTIVSIQAVGKYKTYDIKCLAPYNNFVANRFVVHNCGKSSIAYAAIAEVQKLGGVAALVDAECATDPSYVQALGVNIEALVFSQPTSGEEALDIVAELAENAVVDLIVVDSVAALVPKAEKDAGSIGDQQMGLHPRLMSKAMRILAGPASKSNTTIMFTNQWREKMSLYGGKVAPGGNALKYYASQRVTLSRTDNKPIMEDGQPIGTSIKAKVIKNKVSPPFKEADFVIKYGRGIDKTLDVLRTALIRGVVIRAGAWFKYGDTQLGQGEENACEFLFQNPDVLSEIVGKII